MSIDFNNGFIVGLATSNGSTSGNGGKYDHKDIIDTANLSVLQDGGTEIWSKLSIVTAQALACDRLGNLYLSQSSIIKYDPLGNVIWTNPGRASAMVVDDDFNVYVAYYASSGVTVRKIDSNGVDIWTLSDIPLARGIAVDAMGNVYVAYYGSTTAPGGLRKLDPNGNEVWRIFDVKNAKCVVVDSVGNIYVGYYHLNFRTMMKVNSSGSILWEFSDQSQVYAMAIDSGDNVYLGYWSSPNRWVDLVKVSSNGERLNYPLGIESPIMSLCVDSLDSVYVARYVASGVSLVKFNKFGTQIWSKSDLPYIYGIAVSGEALYIGSGNNTASTKKLIKAQKDVTYTITG